MRTGCLPRSTLTCSIGCLLALAASLPASVTAAPPTMASVLAESTAADWRRPDPEDLLYVELPTGRVIVELAPQYAPRHSANIRKLVREDYFDGLAVVRAQENYVVQWGDPDADGERARPVRTAQRNLPPEFSVKLDLSQPFTRLPDGDVYAPEAGFLHGFPAARDPASGDVWLAHCYGMVGAGRGATADSGDGSSLYVVIGHSPRHLDRNITLVGRVLQGMEHMTTLPRGSGPLGFYEDPKQHVPVRDVNLAADVAESQRTPLEVMRTDTPTFARLIEARRNRREEWFLHPTGRVELCNVPVPVRAVAQEAQEAQEAEPAADGGEDAVER